MPNPAYILTEDDQGRKVFTTYRVIRRKGGWRSFPTMALATEHAELMGGLRIDRVETTIVWTYSPTGE